MDKKEIEIPFGAFDSELMHQEIYIPEGFEAEIKGNKIILKKTDSEDERIRNAVEAILNDTEPHIYNGLGILKTDILSWFEKHGKPANKVEPKFHEGEWVVFNNRHDSVYQVEKIENYEYTLRHFLGGSMPLSFSHGDMIRAWTVKDARDGDVLTDGDYPCLFKSINEGKGMFVYCGINGCRNFVTKDDGEDNLLWDDAPENYCPATKEQRDTLFEKMKEAGYEWDIEKKELKKIEDEEYNGEDYGIDGLWHAMNILEKTLGKVSGYQTDDGFLSHQCAITAVKKLCKQKTSKWSEEDENRINHLIAYFEDKESFTAEDDIAYTNWLKSLKDRVQPKQEWNEYDENMRYKATAVINKLCAEGKEYVWSVNTLKQLFYWLKSLKPQNTWKPTDLQLECLSDAIERYNSEGYPASTLKELLEQLKRIG